MTEPDRIRFRHFRAYDGMNLSPMIVTRLSNSTARDVLTTFNIFYPGRSWVVLMFQGKPQPLDEPVPLYGEDLYQVIDEEGIEGWDEVCPYVMKPVTYSNAFSALIRNGPEPIQTSPDEIGELEFQRR